MGLFNVFSNNERDKQLSHIQNLIDVAYADGNIDDTEIELIVSIGGKYDITREEIMALKEKRKFVRFSPPSSYSAKVKLLEDLVKVMVADKEIDEKEIEICKSLALKLHLSPVIIDDLVMSLVNEK
jgi:uncharacterized tellurite resistance protein B-like protein